MNIEDYNFKHDKHYTIIAYTGSGKSILTEQLFLSSPIPSIYFNTQLNNIKGGVHVHKPSIVKKLYLNGVKKIVYDPIFLQTNNIDLIIKDLEFQLKELISIFISYKQTLLNAKLINKSTPIRFYIDEGHLFQDSSSVPMFLKFLATSGRSLGIFLTIIGQRAQLINNNIKQESIFIVGYLHPYDVQFIEIYVPQITQVEPNEHIFYMYDYFEQKKVKMKVIM